MQIQACLTPLPMNFNYSLDTSENMILKWKKQLDSNRLANLSFILEHLIMKAQS